MSNEPVPADFPATVAAEALRTPTNEWPLVLGIRFESSADEPRTFAVEPSGPFPVGRVTAENRSSPTDSTPQRLVLAGRDAGSLREECWTIANADGPSSPPSAADRVRLEPGESVRVERAVLNHEANDVCYPVGAYRFSMQFRTAPVGTSPSDGRSHPWGFTLEVSGLRPDR